MELTDKKLKSLITKKVKDYGTSSKENGSQGGDLRD